MSWIDALAGFAVGWALSTFSYSYHWYRYEKWKAEKRKEIDAMFPRTALEKLESEGDSGHHVLKFDAREMLYCPGCGRAEEQHSEGCPAFEPPDSEHMEPRGYLCRECGLVVSRKYMASIEAQVCKKCADEIAAEETKGD